MPETLKKDTAYHFPDLLLLEASAGSGKTYALVQRYVQFILSACIPNNDIGNILAVTFTNNAAREMKSRILEWLKTLALKSDAAKLRQTQSLLELDPGELPATAERKLQDILSRYTDFRIQTIDSFMNGILNACALELGLRPEPQVTLNYDELLNYALALLLQSAGTAQDRELDELLAEYLAALNENAYKDFIWDPVKDFKAQLNLFLELEAKNLAELGFLDCRAQLDRNFAVLEQAYRNLQAHNLPLKFKLGDYFQDKDIAKLAVSKFDFPVKKTALPREQLPLYERLKEAWLDLLPCQAAMAEAYTYTKVSFYGKLYRRFKANLATVKQRRGMVHISDINSSLSRFLQAETVPEVYFRLGERLCHYLIDEFQDTDPVQWQSLTPLLYESLAQAGSLFMVGDLKQAIYMFRKADYKIMGSLRQELKGLPPDSSAWLPASVSANAALESLGTNYRSGGVILDYLNLVFKHNLRNWIQACGYEDRSQLASFTQEPVEARAGEGYVRTEFVEPRRPSGPPPGEPETNGNDFTDEAEAEEQEAETGSGSPEKSLLLEIIAGLVSRGYRFSDIAILTEKNTEMETVVGWLAEAGIPATASGALDIRKRKIIAEVIELLKFLDSPVQDLAFSQVLTGSLFLAAAVKLVPGISREQMLAWLNAWGLSARDKEYLYIAFREQPEFQLLWQELINPLFQKTGYLPLYDLTCLALQKLQLWEHFPGETGAGLKLLEVINRLEEDGKNSLSDFLAAARKPENEIFNMLLPEYLDAVQLLTFHKSKGLGFPVVINLIYNSAKRSQTGLYVRKREGQLVAQYLNKALFERFAETCPDMVRPYREAREEELLQQLNLWYVICTRAQYELYNLIIPSARPSPELMALFTPGEWGAQTCAPSRTAGRGQDPLMPPGIPESREDDSASAQSRVQALRLEELKLGRIYHEWLRQLEYLPESREPSAVPDGPEAEDSGGRELLRGFLNHPGIRQWFMPKPGRTVWREVEYVDAAGMLYRMDRIVEDPEVITVLDFKTSRERTAGHKAQLKNYLKLVRQSHPGVRVQGYLAYLENPGLEEVN